MEKYNKNKINNKGKITQVRVKQNLYKVSIMKITKHR